MKRLFFALVALLGIAACEPKEPQEPIVEQVLKLTADKSEITADGTDLATFTVKDAEGNTLYVYGIFDQAGTRYDGMAKKPAVGDTVTVLGAAGQYNADTYNAPSFSSSPSAAPKFEELKTDDDLPF